MKRLSGVDRSNDEDRSPGSVYPIQSLGCRTPLDMGIRLVTTRSDPGAGTLDLVDSDDITPTHDHHQAMHANIVYLLSSLNRPTLTYTIMPFHRHAT